MALKLQIIKALNKRFFGSPFRILGCLTRKIPKLFGLTNPFFVSTPVITSGNSLYIAYQQSYLAEASTLNNSVKFSPTSHEPEISFLASKLINDGDIILDIGANVGIHTVTFAKAAGSGQVFAFEPIAEIGTRLSENCALNNIKNVTLVPHALGAKAGMLEMSVNVSGKGLEGTSSFVDSVHVRNSPELYEKRSVKIFELDQLIPSLGITKKLDFIKMDVEGFETDVLEGATNTIKAHEPIMIIEAQTNRLQQADKSLNWYLTTFENYHIFKIPAADRTNPYLRLERLTGSEKNIAVNLLFLPKLRVGTY